MQKEEQIALGSNPCDRDSGATQTTEEQPGTNEIHYRIPTLRRIVIKLQQEIELLECGSELERHSFAEEVSRFERSLICTALSKTGGHQIRAAKLLGIKPTTLNAKIKRYRIVPAIYSSLPREEELISPFGEEKVT